jgi:hypothetical protein
MRKNYLSTDTTFDPDLFLLDFTFMMHLAIMYSKQVKLTVSG